MNKKKALVVDDSAFMRKMISNIINTSSEVEVVATARNGEDALNKIAEFRPDVITLDVEMPIMDGIDTLKAIFTTKSIPVVMLSSLTKAGADKTMEAMALGAIDFISKPSGSISLDIERIKSEIIKKVEQAARINLHTIKKSSEPNNQQKSYKPITSSRAIVMIGSSTGGPRALQEVITKLPANFQAPVAIVQHMPKGFTKSLAERLNKLSAIKVKEVEHGDEMLKGNVYIAPGGKQFKIVEKGDKWIAQVQEEQPLRGHQPAVDILFESVASLSACYPISVILTGMGSDGTDGIIQLKKNHPRTITISQSKETCVVYGMPQAAEKTRLVDYVEDIADISNVLIQKVQKKR